MRDLDSPSETFAKLLDLFGHLAPDLSPDILVNALAQELLFHHLWVIGKRVEVDRQPGRRRQAEHGTTAGYPGWRLALSDHNVRGVLDMCPSWSGVDERVVVFRLPDRDGLSDPDGRDPLPSHLMTRQIDRSMRSRWSCLEPRRRSRHHCHLQCFWIWQLVLVLARLCLLFPSRLPSRPGIGDRTSIRAEYNVRVFQLSRKFRSDHGYDGLERLGHWSWGHVPGRRPTERGDGR